MELTMMVELVQLTSVILVSRYILKISFLGKQHKLDKTPGKVSKLDKTPGKVSKLDKHLAK